MTPAIFDNKYHIPLIRNTLTRALPSILPIAIEELREVFDETLSLSNKRSSDGWITVPGLDHTMDIIGRASNRIFVGLPLCRNQEYLEVMKNYTIDVVIGANILGFFPQGMKS